MDVFAFLHSFHLGRPTAVHTKQASRRRLCDPLIFPSIFSGPSFFSFLIPLFRSVVFAILRTCPSRLDFDSILDVPTAFRILALS